MCAYAHAYICIYDYKHNIICMDGWIDGCMHVNERIYVSVTVYVRECVRHVFVV
jgi:hypothetical protein